MDSYIYGITALLPLAAAMLVFQVNPYHALVIRGILGAIAASSSTPPYRITTRLRRLYDLMNGDFLAAMAQLSYVDPAAV